MKISVVVLLLLAVAMAAGGCASGCGEKRPPPPPIPLGVTIPALVGGALTNERPAVGLLSLPGGGICTGTLVAPRIVMTAAHCYGWTMTNVNRSLGSFAMADSAGHPQPDVAVIQVWNYGVPAYFGVRDVALSILGRCMDGFTAPEAVASAQPANGTQVVQFGYGCQDRVKWCASGAKPNALGQKQKISFAFGTSKDGCPGGSGGPLFGPDGLFAVDSAASPCGEKVDVYGDASAHRTDVETLASLYPCAFSEQAGTLHPMNGTLFVSLVGGGGQAFRPDGPYANELLKTAGLRTLFRFVRTTAPLANVLAYRPLADGVACGIIRSENGAVWLEGCGRTATYFTGTSAASVLADLKANPGQQALVFGTVDHDAASATGNTRFFVAQRWSATAGLF